MGNEKCHQGGIIFDALVGDVEVRQQLVGQKIQVAYLVAALNLTFDFTCTKIFRFAFELGNLIKSSRVFQELDLQ